MKVCINAQVPPRYSHAKTMKIQIVAPLSNHNPITPRIQSHSNHGILRLGRLVYQMLARRAMLPSPKLHPLAWRGTLTPDIISQPVSPRPRKKDGSRFTNPRKHEKIRIARPSAGSIFLSPHSGGASWRWIHLSFPRTDKRTGAGPMALTPLGLHTQRQ